MWDPIKSHTLREHINEGKREKQILGVGVALLHQRKSEEVLRLPQSLPLWIIKVSFRSIMFMVLREIHDVRRSCFIYIQLCILEYMMINNVQHVVSEHG